MKVTQLTAKEWLVWENDRQVASFVETFAYGPFGLWNGNNYYGPDAEAQAEKFSKNEK